MTYRYETIEYPTQKSRFDVDATYVINVGSNARASTNKDGQEPAFSKTVHFLHVPIMATECYVSIFRDSLERNYDRILVLVDSCFFGQTLDTERVNAFLNDTPGEPYVYALSCLPIFMLPAKHHSYRVLGLGVCAAVYSKAFRNLVLNSEIGDWNLFLLRNSKLYAYEQPMCYSQQYQPLINATGCLGYHLIYGIAKIMIYLAILFALGLFWTVFHYNQVYTFLRRFIRNINLFGYTLDPLIQMVEPVLYLLRPASRDNPMMNL